MITDLYLIKFMELNKMEKYTLNLDTNNYVLSIAHTLNDNIELDLSSIDLKHISCYRFINNTLVLDKTKLSENIAKEEQDKTKQELLSEKSQLETWLKDHDYIGTKIATGRATVEEYATEIEEMTEKAERINEIDRLLESL